MKSPADNASGPALASALASKTRPEVGKTSDVSPDAADRRNFFVKVLAVAIGGVITVIPFAAGLAFFFDPILRKRPAALRDPASPHDADGFVRVTSIASLPADGEPKSFTVSDDLVDAWNKFSAQPIGRVFLRRLPDGSVTAFNVRCPHLGCAVDFRPSEGDYFCPCHTSTFDLDGHKKNEIPPRDMDALEVKVKKGTDEIWVKYKSFKAGTEEQIPA